MFFSGFFCGFERCGSVAFPNFRGGNFPEKCVRTNSRILHQKGKVKEFWFASLRSAASSGLQIPYWCGMGESNSQSQFGKLMLYHLTNPAMLCIIADFLHFSQFFKNPHHNKTRRTAGFVVSSREKII